MKKEQDIEFEGVCYVLVRTNKINPIAHKRHDLIWYPERAMTLCDQVQYVPYVKSIVTENPWLIACYPREKVRVWDERFGSKDCWQMPNRQTYGGSVNNLTMTLLGIGQTIPSTPMDGGTAIRKHLDELEKMYRKAQKYKPYKMVEASFDERW
jgi:hypothetical protein